MSGISTTSYAARRFPALITESETLVNGNLNCSSTHRVQPSSMLPVHGLYRATRGGLTATDGGALPLRGLACPHHTGGGSITPSSFARNAPGGTTAPRAVRIGLAVRRTP